MRVNQLINQGINQARLCFIADEGSNTDWSMSNMTDSDMACLFDAQQPAKEEEQLVPKRMARLGLKFPPNKRKAFTPKKK